MRRAMLVVGAALALGMGGCAVTDALLGTKHNPDGTVENTGSGGIVGTVGGVLGFPWVATGIAALAGLYAEYKRRGWKSAAVSTFDAIETFKRSAEGAKVWESLKEKLGTEHADAKVTELVNKALGNT